MIETIIGNDWRSVDDYLFRNIKRTDLSLRFDCIIGVCLLQIIGITLAIIVFLFETRIVINAMTLFYKSTSKIILFITSFISYSMQNI